MPAVCHDCPTNKDRAKAFGREVAAGVVLPFFLYGIVIGALIITGTGKVT